MKRVTNVAASVRQRLLNEAKRRGESFDYIVSLYARERFLARLGGSPHRNRFILKGATVFALWSQTHRPTRDLDFLGSGNFDAGEAVAVIRDIIEISADDGLLFDSASLTAKAIREADEYRGVRVQLTATLDGARLRLQIDIGVGDVVTPPARQAALPTVLDDFSPPRVRVYPAETIVAEKLHAMVKLGIANSRMKDFFDVYVLASRREFDEGLLSKAVNRTFKRRRTAIPKEAFALSEDFYEDRGKQKLWRAFLRKSGVSAPDDFTAVGKVLRTFLTPVLNSAGGGMPDAREWRSLGWRKRR
jgi:predicted nucleotidyltransferase component of viral defense system